MLPCAQRQSGIPSSSQGLVYAGRQLQDERSLASYGVGPDSTLHLVLRLVGGKGGFGALLRGQGRDGKITTNFDAMRDLQGRRLKHANTEKKLREWKALAGERALEKVALKHIKDQARKAKKEEEEEVGVRVRCQGSTTTRGGLLLLRVRSGVAAARPMHVHRVGTCTPLAALVQLARNQPPCALVGFACTQVDVQSVVDAQKAMLAKVQVAVQDALASGGPGPSSGGKRSAGAEPPAKAQAPAKKSKMMSALEELGSEESSSSSDDEDA